MSVPSLGRLIARVASASLALAMIGLMLSPKVEAACGQGSHSKTERASVSVFADLEILSSDLSSDRPVSDSPPRRPCSGPGCSDGGPQAPTAPTPPSAHRGERWLCMVTQTVVAELKGVRLAIGETSPIAVNHANALERPPRFLPA